MEKQKEVVTFKLERSVIQMMRGITNRSEFIRNAILAALDSVCPFCKGTGVLSPHKREHWKSFTEIQKLDQCKDCEDFLSVSGKSA